MIRQPHPVGLRCVVVCRTCAVRTAVRARRAFTLLEILVVAALLTALAAIVMPSISNMGNRGAIMTASGDVLRFLSETRRQAVDDGIRYWVRYESGGQAIIAGPDGGVATKQLVLTGACEFSTHESPEALPDLVAEAIETELRQAAWSPEISYYSDGTATDSLWQIEDDGGRERVFTLRGLTGRCRVGTQKADE